MWDGSRKFKILRSSSVGFDGVDDQFIMLYEGRLKQQWLAEKMRRGSSGVARKKQGTRQHRDAMMNDDPGRAIITNLGPAKAHHHHHHLVLSLPLPPLFPLSPFCPLMHLIDCPFFDPKFLNNFFSYIQEHNIAQTRVCIGILST